MFRSDRRKKKISILSSQPPKGRRVYGDAYIIFQATREPTHRYVDRQEPVKSSPKPVNDKASCRYQIRRACFSPKVVDDLIWPIGRQHCRTLEVDSQIHRFGAEMQAVYPFLATAHVFYSHYSMKIVFGRGYSDVQGMIPRCCCGHGQRQSCSYHILRQLNTTPGSSGTWQVFTPSLAALSSLKSGENSMVRRQHVHEVAARLRLPPLRAGPAVSTRICLLPTSSRAS